MPIYIDFPFHVDAAQRVAQVDYPTHVEQMVTELLLVSPGERVNRPTFGCGLAELVFDPDDERAAVTVQALVQTSLQTWLGDVLRVDLVAVQAQPDSGQLVIDVSYTLRASGTAASVQVVRAQP